MSHDETMEQIDASKVDEGNFEEYLKQEGFNDFQKIKHLAFKDILICNKQQLIDEVELTGVRGLPQARFVKAIKKLPNSEMHIAVTQLGVGHKIVVIPNGGESEAKTIYDDGNTYLYQLNEMYPKHKFFVRTIAGVDDQLTSDVPLKILFSNTNKDDIVKIEANTDDFRSSKRLKEEKQQFFDEMKKKHV